jgi:hypothetical protein
MNVLLDTNVLGRLAGGKCDYPLPAQTMLIVQGGHAMQPAFIGLGIVGWIIAGTFGCYQTVELRQELPTPGRSAEPKRSVITVTVAPSLVSAAAAGGFAMAGGLCFLAAALVQRSAPPTEQRPVRGAQAERDIAASIAVLEGKRG